MSKKLASEFAIGIISLVAFIIGGIFWLDSIKENNRNYVSQQQAQAPQKRQAADESVKVKTAVSAENPTSEDSCKPHYYEGKEEVSGWFVSENGDGMVVAIKKGETSKLPIADASMVDTQRNFTVKLIDPTEEIKAKIQASTEKKPTTITIQGYAEICQQPPLVSIQPATIAFKGRS